MGSQDQFTSSEKWRVLIGWGRRCFLKVIKEKKNIKKK